MAWRQVGRVVVVVAARTNWTWALLLFGGDADASELRSAGSPTARVELEALKDVDMCHKLMQEAYVAAK